MRLHNKSELCSSPAKSGRARKPASVRTERSSVYISVENCQVVSVCCVGQPLQGGGCMVNNTEVLTPLLVPITNYKQMAGEPQSVIT